MAKRGTQDGELARARKKALQLLRVKLRSTAELRERLSAAGFGAHKVEVVVGELKKLKVLDDAKLADAEVRRMRERGAVGSKAMQAQLKKRGLDADLERAESGSSLAEIVAFASKKLDGMSSNITASAKARRLFGLLARRGIDEDVAGEVIAKLTGVTRDEA